MKPGCFRVEPHCEILKLLIKDIGKESKLDRKFIREEDLRKVFWPTRKKGFHGLVEPFLSFSA